MINNMELILPHFYFNEGNNMFMHCQIVQRAKDHKGERVREGAIKTYFIRSREHLERLMPEIILLCEHYGARAYINLAPKDFDQLQKLMLKKLCDDVCQNNIRNPRKCLNSAAGELKSRCSKWIIDIDDVSIKDSIEEKLSELYGELCKKADYADSVEELLKKGKSTYIYSEIPTKQGVHLIVRPFNLQKFSEAFPDIDVHKNSMGTLLYYPNSIENGRSQQDNPV